MMSSDASSEDKALDPFAVAAVRLLILTGARLNEVLRLRWEDIDFERGLLNLPDSKTGRRTLQLSEAAVQLLASLPRLEDNPHVIPGLRAGSHRADLNRPWRKIKQAAGLPNVRIHDLRHTFASFAAGASLSLPLIGRLLGHKNVSTTARYAHLDAGPVRRAADQVGHDLDTAMSGPVAGRRLDK
jgi:integrase